MVGSCLYDFLSMASNENPGSESNNNGGAASSSTSKDGETPTQIQPFRMPTIEEVRAQDVWNNCAVRSVASGVMGEDWLIKLPSFLFFQDIEINGFCFVRAFDNQLLYGYSGNRWIEYLTILASEWEILNFLGGFMIDWVEILSVV